MVRRIDYPRFCWNNSLRMVLLRTTGSWKRQWVQYGIQSRSHFHFENCVERNKNKDLIIKYRKAILTYGWIKSIMHKYLISGHSQNHGNSAHSNAERHIKKTRQLDPNYLTYRYVSLMRSVELLTCHILCKSCAVTIFIISKVLTLRNRTLVSGKSYSAQDFKVMLLTMKYSGLKQPP